MLTRQKVGAALLCMPFAASAFAADLPTGNNAPVVSSSPSPSVASDSPWGGFYIGANGGYAGSIGKDQSFAAPPGYFPSSPRASGTFTTKQPEGGFAGGVQGGYNYQIGSWVLGVENDFTYIESQKKNGYVFNGSGALPSDFRYVGSENTINWVATGRARVGYVINSLLIYGTAGLAFGNVKNGYCASGSCDTNKTGFAAGGGAEYALTHNWSIKVEGLYVNLGNSTPGVVAIDGSGRTYSGGQHKFENDLAIGRIGINYRF